MSSGTRSRPERLVFDFHGIAGLIDSVLGFAPDRLEVLLRALRSSNERLEARVVLEIVVHCRDPLAPLETLCRDGLHTAADLDRLLHLSTSDLSGCRELRHANAILNLCDAILRQANPYTRRRRQAIRRIRPRVEVAAAAETTSRQQEIERIEVARQAALPHLWETFESFVARNRRYTVDPSKQSCVPGSGSPGVSVPYPDRPE